MGLRDLFDSDKRSKDDLREEIRLRDEQLSSLQVRLAALERQQVDQAGSAAATQPSQHASDERAEQLAQELEGLRAESDRQQRTIEALRQEALDLRSATERDEGVRLALESRLEAQARTVDALRREASELAATGEAERNRSQALLESLEEERRSREEESARRQEEHRKIRDAIAAVKTKREASVSQPDEGVAVPVPSAASQVPTSPPAAATLPRDRAFYAEAHRILMQREARVEAAEKALNALAGRFGLQDGPQALELVARVEQLAREAEAQRKLGDTAQLAALRRTLSDVNNQLLHRTRERDQALEQSRLERESASASTAARLRQQVSTAESEIKQLRQIHADELVRMKVRAETAEEKFRLNAFDFRNLELRLANAEKAHATLKEESQRLKRDTVPVATHRAECARLQGEIGSEKARVDLFRDEAQHLQRELSKNRELVEQLKKDLLAAKAAKAVVALRPDSTFMNPTVLAWLVEDGDPESADVANGWLGRIGEGPWPDMLIREILEGVDYEFWETPDADLRHLIVGRRGWTEEGLLEQIDAVQGEPLRVYSQEMFLAKLMAGRDPFDSNDEALLMAFAQGHPALEFLLSLPVPWPAVSEPDSGEVDPVDSDDYGVAETPLHKLGYRVGATSALTEGERRQILTECYETADLEFTPFSSDEYIRKWGRRRSAQRLYRIAAHLKWLAEGLGRDPRRPQAGRDWINDLEWLRKNYYAPYRGRFTWP